MKKKKKVPSPSPCPIGNMESIV